MVVLGSSIYSCLSIMDYVYMEREERRLGEMRERESGRVREVREVKEVREGGIGGRDVEKDVKKIREEKGENDLCK